MKTTLVLISLVFTINVYSQIHFQNTTNQVISEPHFSGSVIGVSDMNADGLDDIVRLADGKSLSICFQTGPGKPFKITDYGPLSPYQVWNTAIADIDHNGYNDIVFAANENKAYIYYGVRTAEGIKYSIESLDSSQTAYAQAGNLIDINKDGWLDYFLCNDIGLNLIWAGNKQGKINGNPVNWIDFRTSPVSDNSGNYGSTWNDFDNDGDLDLYIAKCKSSATSPSDPRRINTFYRNNGNFTFTESASEIGLASGAQSWVAVAGDSDNDGDLDIFVINHFSPNELFINDGSGKFSNKIINSGINYSGIGVQAAWVDLDNDGWLDLIISGSQHQIYKNKGGNNFELIDSKELGLFQIESFAIGDLNNDGKQDIYTSYSQIFNQASHRPDAIFFNQSSVQNHFIKIRLEGVQSNKSAIGARINLYAGGLKQMREIQSGYSYGVHNSLTQHFGIGTATRIDSIVLRWPSGIKEKIEGPFIDRTLVIKENQCFGFDPLISSFPVKNVICSPSDSFKLTIPLVGTYSWTNGATTKEIVVRNEGDYQVKLVNVNGCTLYSNMVSIIKDPKSRYKINVTDSVICDGSVSTLTIASPFKLKWNTGDSGRTIQINKEGKYFAVTENECGTSLSDTINLRLIKPVVTSTKNDTVSLSTKAILRAEGSSLSWFAESQGGSAIATGNTYQTLPLNKTTTFYVQSILVDKGKPFSVGLKEFDGPSKLHAVNFSGALFFDASADCILKSVKVYTDTAGSREINLVSSAGKILQSKVVRIEKGQTTIALDFYITAGLGYKLTTNDDATIKVFGFKSPLLYRTEGAIPFPLIAGPITLYGTNAGAANYYYFYDWKLAYPDLECKSDRVPVQAVLKTVSLREDPFQYKWSVFPNPSDQFLTINLDNSFFRTPVKYEILNFEGKVIQRGFFASAMRLELNSYVSGMYAIRIAAYGKESIKKFSKL